MSFCQRLDTSTKRHIIHNIQITHIHITLKKEYELINFSTLL